MILLSPDDIVRGAVLAFFYEETPEWPRKDFMALRKLFDQGLSFALMARRLGRNRNQVMGKVYRQKWDREGTKLAVRSKQQRRPKKPPTASAKALTLTPLIAHGIALTDLTPTCCRFVIGEDAKGFRFCTGTKRTGSPYCEGHHRRCYKKRKAA